MATFSSGRGPAPYIRNLNVQDAQIQEAIITDEELRKELEIFTNTEFFDFDSGRHTDFQASPVKPSTTATFMNDFGMGYLPRDFGYGGFDSSLPSPSAPSFPGHVASLPPPQPLVHAGLVHPTQPSHDASLSFGRQGEPEAVHPVSVAPLEDQSRRMADEDKRRRNTAASARFRIKKKQREQAMEKTAKDMADKVTQLQSRISTLETENKWLRSLVMDKYVDKQGQRLVELLDQADASKLLTQLDMPN